MRGLFLAESRSSYEATHRFGSSNRETFPATPPRFGWRLLRRFTAWVCSSSLHHLLGYKHAHAQFFQRGEL
ncbi:hypothetical protein GGD66_001695 [Bradyrhizobium sp. CIR48]|nr:hypothetical protein [Bradyrhizobium sp. SBR1B]MBB4423155.1 hypothetical protein [Bradyrhizobium sp. CIR48]